MKKVTALIILDGFAKGKAYSGNAITNANTPNLNILMDKYPNTLISASGTDVGLPVGQMGNSEVGHMNMGAGRVVLQELSRIKKEISDKSFYNNKVINELIDYALANNKGLNVMGLLSDGGVHSHITHLYTILELCKMKGLKNVKIHCFMDGRDVSPTSGAGFVQELQDKIKEIGVGKIASIMGRYYAMDRDKRWERVEEAYDALVNGVAVIRDNPVEAVKESYEKNITDEFIKPILIKDETGNINTVEKQEGVLFYNFRPDRAREITRAFVDADFDGFKRELLNVKFVCMTQYDKTIENVSVAYSPGGVVNTFGEYISKLGMKQLRIAETEKYAHVTFFFNGGLEEPYENEDRILIPSPKVATYDLKPEMSAYEVKDEVIKQIEKDKYDVVIINFANPDMVGHTGDLNAAIQAVETVDKCIGEIINVILKVGGQGILTADHGNCDVMVDEQDLSPVTTHTTNPVPLVVFGDQRKFNLRDGGVLADIAPTLLDMMGIEKPEEMTGKSLIIKNK